MMRRSRVQSWKLLRRPQQTVRVDDDDDDGTGSRLLGITRAFMTLEVPKRTNAREVKGATMMVGTVKRFKENKVRGVTGWVFLSPCVSPS